LFLNILDWCPIGLLAGTMFIASKAINWSEYADLVYWASGSQNSFSIAKEQDQRSFVVQQ
jgi:hypothetical protein